MAVFVVIGCTDKNEFITENSVIKAKNGSIFRSNSNWSTLHDSIAARSERARREFFSGIPSGFDKFESDTPGTVIEGVELPEGYDPDNDIIDWTDYVIIEPKEGKEEYMELPEENWDVLEIIQALILEAGVTGDYSKLIDYLQQQGLYDLLVEITEKYGLDDLLNEAGN